MTKIDIAKRVVSTVVGLGATKVVNSIIVNNTNPKTVTDTVTIASASFVLGSMVADRTREYTDAKIDEAHKWWSDNVTNKS